MSHLSNVSYTSAAAVSFPINMRSTASARSARARYHVLTFDCVRRAVKDAHGPRTVQLADGEQLPWGCMGRLHPDPQSAVSRSRILSPMYVRPRRYVIDEQAEACTSTV